MKLVTFTKLILDLHHKVEDPYKQYDILFRGHPGEIGCSIDEDSIEVDEENKIIYVNL